MTAVLWLTIVVTTVAFGCHAWESNGGPEWPATITSVAAGACGVLVLLLALLGEL